MKKIKIIAVLTALVMFVCFFMVLSSNNNTKKDAEKFVNAVNVSAVVATQDISPYTMLTNDMVELRQVTVAENTAGYYAALGDVVGKVCTSDIFSGEIITENRIADEQDTAIGLAHKIEDGKRAITIEVDIEQAVANTIRVGNYVDIIFFTEVENMNDNNEVTAGVYFNSLLGDQNPANTVVLQDNIGLEFATISLQKIKVLALDDTFFSSKNDPVTGNSYSSVTLEVTPEQAAQLALMNEGKSSIVFVLRPQDDDSTVNNNRSSVLKNVD